MRRIAIVFSLIFFGSYNLHAQTAIANLSLTAPATATTTAYTPVTGLADYHSMGVVVVLAGSTGGTLDIYVQYSPDKGVSWADYAHFAQITAGAAAITRSFATSKYAQQLTVATIGTGLTPALAANTVTGGDFGDRIRVVMVAGSGTSAGAVQSLKFTFSK